MGAMFDVQKFDKIFLSCHIKYTTKILSILIMQQRLKKPNCVIDKIRKAIHNNAIYIVAFTFESKSHRGT